MQHLLVSGNSNTFIRDPVLMKAMYDAVEDMQPKTLSSCFLLETNSRGPCSEIIYRDMMDKFLSVGF